MSLSPSIRVLRSYPLRCSVSSTSADTSRNSNALSEGLAHWGLHPNRRGKLHVDVLHENPPLLQVQHLLTDEECDAIINRQRYQQEESDLYLNYRVNRELDVYDGITDTASDGGDRKSAKQSVSSEAQALINEWQVPASALHAGDKSGFRTQIDPNCAELQAIMPKIQQLLGLEHRSPEFAENLWIRPSKRTFCVRDQTVVHYSVGEGVSPHVDGKDATVLLYLNGDERNVAGGATCFPEVGIRVLPKKGTALVYWSKKELLHYAERVLQGEKWICQLLVDFKVREDELDVDYRTGQIY